MHLTLQMFVLAWKTSPVSTWLWNTARGINGEEVKERLLPLSHGCGKTFPGPKALKSISEVQNWLNELCEELSERIESDLEQNQRVAQTLTLHARASQSNSETEKKFPSKSCPLRYGAKRIQEDAMKLFTSELHEYIGSHCPMKPEKPDCNYWAVTALSVSASNILAVPSGVKPITKYFHGRNTACYSSERPSDVVQETKHEPSSSLNSVKDGRNGSNQIEEEAHVSHESISNDTDKSSKDSNDTNNSWKYSLDKIDPSVLKELPAEIQEEIHRALSSHERERAKKAKRGSSIVHYFSRVNKE